MMVERVAERAAAVRAAAVRVEALRPAAVRTAATTEAVVRAVAERAAVGMEMMVKAAVLMEMAPTRVDTEAAVRKAVGMAAVATDLDRDGSEGCGGDKGGTSVDG